MSLELSQDDAVADDTSAPTTWITNIFKSLLDDTVHDLSALENPKANSLHVLNLLLTLVVQCNKSEEKTELARSMRTIRHLLHLLG